MCLFSWDECCLFPGQEDIKTVAPVADFLEILPSAAKGILCQQFLRELWREKSRDGRSQENEMRSLWQTETEYMKDTEWLATVFLLYFLPSSTTPQCSGHFFPLRVFFTCYYLVLYFTYQNWEFELFQHEDISLASIYFRMPQFKTKICRCWELCQYHSTANFIPGTYKV